MTGKRSGRSTATDRANTWVKYMGRDWLVLEDRGDTLVLRRLIISSTPQPVTTTAKASEVTA